MRGYLREKTRGREGEKREGCAESVRQWAAGRHRRIVILSRMELSDHVFVHPSIARNEKWPCLNVSRALQYGKQRVVDAAFTTDSYDGLSRLQPREQKSVIISRDSVS